MSGFAVDHVPYQTQLDSDASTSFNFGPPTPGIMRVMIYAVEVMDLGDFPPSGPGPLPPPGDSGFGQPGGTIPLLRPGPVRGVRLSAPDLRAASGAGSDGETPDSARQSSARQSPAPASLSSGNPSPGQRPDSIQMRRPVQRPGIGTGVGGLVIDGGIGPGGGGGDIPPPRTISPQAFVIEIIDAGETVRYSGNGPAEFDVPEPQFPVMTFGAGPRWKIRITNTSRFRASINVNVLFHGHRPILSRDIDLDFINEKLDLIINDPQPFQIAFETEDIRNRIPNGANFPFPINHTFVKLTADPAWVELHPGLSGLEQDLGAHVFKEGTKSYRITVKATIHDGALALRLRAEFPSFQGKIDVLEVLDALGADLAANIGEVIVGLTPADRPMISINSFGLDIFLVLRPSGVSGRPLVAGPHFEVVARPRIDLSPGWASIVVDALMQVAFERLLPESAGAELRENAVSFLGWLLGERNLEVTGNHETLALQYAGDAPRVDAILDPTLSGAAPEPLSPGNLSKIDHIVVLMMENRSFDHMLGFLSLPPSGNEGRVGLGRAEVEGLRGNETNPLNTRGARQRVFSLALPRQGPQVNSRNETRGTRFPHDPGHGFKATKNQRGNYDITIPANLPGKVELLENLDPADLQPSFFHVGPNEGFVLDFARRLDGRVSAAEEQILRGEVMGYQPAEHVPTYRFLAENFAICDHWFAAHPGPTWPNRFVTLTGRLAPGPDQRPQLDNPDVGSFDPLETLTIFDHLTAAGVEWRYYEHDFCMIRLFSRYTFDRDRVVSMNDPERGFFETVRRGQLPPVVFIDPDLTDVPPGNDDHPPADIKDGQALVKEIYDALAGGPQEQWRKTLFIIVYDEHGGFYDHVHPQPQRLFDPNQPELGGFAPLARDPDTNEPVDFYGMRVPAFVISPWVPARSVSKVEYDHTSIIKTIMARFLPQQPPNMGRRAALAADLGPMLSLSMPRRLSQAPQVVLNPDRRFIPSAGTRPTSDDFHAFMGALRGRLARR